MQIYRLGIMGTIKIFYYFHVNICRTVRNSWSHWLRSCWKMGPVHHQLIKTHKVVLTIDPRHMAVSKQLCLPQMKIMLHTLVEAKHAGESCAMMSSNNSVSFLWLGSLTPKTDQRQWGRNHNFPECGMWWSYCLCCLAAVEQGFSTNKEIIIEKQKVSLVAQRLIIDHVRSVGGINKVEITKVLLLSAAGARHKYHG